MKILEPKVRRVFILDRRAPRAERTQSFTVVGSASLAMAHPAHAKIQPEGLDLPTFARFRDERTYDPALDCYVKPERPPAPRPRRPKGEWKRIDNGVRSKGAWIYCRQTGVRLVHVSVDTLAEAQALAAEFAVANGGRAGDCYARFD